MYLSAKICMICLLVNRAALPVECWLVRGPSATPSATPSSIRRGNGRGFRHERRTRFFSLSKASAISHSTLLSLWHGVANKITTLPPDDTHMALDHRGDAQGAALLLQDVSVCRGANLVLQNISWRVEPKQRWALLGGNGVGKTSLLKAIVGEIGYNGNIVVGTQQTVGYLQQTAVAGSTRTVYQEAASGQHDLVRLQYDMERATARGDLHQLQRLHTQYEARGGYEQEKHVTAMLHGLGFQNIQQCCHELSGGWQMRVGLAKLLLSRPTLCVLDEPSNHLDAAAQAWLANYLRSYQQALILVTHNVNLLSCVDHIAELTAGGGPLQTYKSCNYAQYRALQQQRARTIQAAYERQQAQAAHLQRFVDRFGASATKASAAQSRVKQLAKMRAQGLLDAPPNELVATARFRPSLQLPAAPPLVGNILVSLQHANVGYNADAPLLIDVNLDLTKGMRVLIRGPNGAGKSSLLHALTGALPLLDGNRMIASSNVHLGVFTQDLAQQLDPTARAVDCVTAFARTSDLHVSDQQARAVLGKLGLSADKALRLVGDLSGGEKARVALARFSLKPSHAYFLDEVSNHLDRECLEALSDALNGWDAEGGAICVISHDKAFCGQLEFTHVVTLFDKNVKVEQRDARDEDWEMTSLATQRRAPQDHRGEHVDAVAPTAPALYPATRKKAHNAPKRITKLESLVIELELHVANLDAEMLQHGRDVGKLQELNKEKELVESQIGAFLDEWQELEELVVAVGKTR